MLNRQEQPKIHAFSDLNLSMPEVSELSNGSKLHLLPFGDLEIIRLDLLLNCGTWDSQMGLDADFTAELLKEGSEEYSALEIAEKLDETGSYLQATAGMNQTIVSLFTLHKHINTMLPILESVVKRPLLAAEDFETHRQKTFQQFKQDCDKARFLSAREFKKTIFGADHPYGNITTEKDYQNIRTEHLKEYHKAFYGSVNCEIMLSGWVTAPLIDEVKKHFGAEWGCTTKNEEASTIEITPKGHSQTYIQKKGAVQSAINLGYAAIAKSHPDFFGLQILNTLLGGYFGSRLMQNIREVKGYTYGIGSVLIPYPSASLFSIHTETANEYRDEVMLEIQKEIQNLQYTLVSEEELETVKSFLRGDLIRNTDSLFPITETIHSLLEFKLDASYLHQYLQAINTITPEEIKMLAQKYLQMDKFQSIIVGA